MCTSFKILQQLHSLHDLLMNFANLFIVIHVDEIALERKSTCSTIISGALCLEVSLILQIPNWSFDEFRKPFNDSSYGWEKKCVNEGNPRLR